MNADGRKRPLRKLAGQWEKSWSAPFDVGCLQSACLFICVRNDGVVESPEFDVAIGSYWKVTMDALAPLAQRCVLAPRTDSGRLVVDPQGAVGESDETNNELIFELGDGSG
jgi:hypothetical protein